MSAWSLMVGVVVLRKPSRLVVVVLNQRDVSLLVASLLARLHLRMRARVLSHDSPHAESADIGL